MTQGLGPASVGISSDVVDGAIAAIQASTDYAQASITLVPRLTGLPNWYAGIQAAITAAQTTSRSWLTAICPALSQGLPQEILRFSTTFGTQVDKLLAILADAGTTPLTPAQQAALSAALADLLTATGHQADQAQVVRKQLEAYQTQLVADIGGLTQAIADLETHLTEGSQYVQKLKMAYGQSFVEVASKISPCTVIVMLNMDVQVSVIGTGAPQEAIAIVVAQTIVGAIHEDQTNSFAPVQAAMDAWGTLQAKIAAVTSDVAAAKSDGAAVLKGFDLNTARIQWAELAYYAARFLPGPDNPDP